MLAEPAYFTEHARLGDRLVPIDERSDVEICEYIPEYDGIWRISGGYHVGVDPDGFFIDEVTFQPDDEVLDQPSRTVYRSRRFHEMCLPGRSGVNAGPALASCP